MLPPRRPYSYVLNIRATARECTAALGSTRARARARARARTNIIICNRI